MGTLHEATDRDYTLDRESIKTVLRWRLEGPLDAYYRQWRSDELAARSREDMLNQAADEVLRMLHLHSRP